MVSFGGTSVREMMRTGVFFHYQEGERLRDFPEALKGVLAYDNVILYDAYYPMKSPSSFDLDMVPIDIVLQIHTQDMVERVRQSESFEGALMSASGTIAAAVRIWDREINNAFVFTGYGDHHAGRNHFGGGCYFNGAAIAISELRRRFGASRFAIVDTDAHHGDGTWELFENDPDVLYICFCSGPHQERNQNVNVQVGWHMTDQEYLELVRSALPKVQTFGPEAIFWNWGYDGTRGEYGDIGLTPEAHIRLAELLVESASQSCSDRLITVLCGGHGRHLISYLAPKVVHVLSGGSQSP